MVTVNRWDNKACTTCHGCYEHVPGCPEEGPEAVTSRPAWPYNAKDVEATMQAMKLLAKKPQLPHRLRCTAVTSTEFAVALMKALREREGNALLSNGPEHPIAKHVGTGYKVPRACAELYLEWVQPTGKGSTHRPGTLTGCSLDTVARLAVDVFLEELAAWRQRVPQTKTVIIDSLSAFGAASE